jgi:hypothetical protein
MRTAFTKTIFGLALALCGLYRAALGRQGLSGPGGQKASVSSALHTTSVSTI